MGALIRIYRNGATPSAVECVEGFSGRHSIFQGKWLQLLPRSSRVIKAFESSFENVSANSQAGPASSPGDPASPSWSRELGRSRWRPFSPLLPLRHIVLHSGLRS